MFGLGFAKAVKETDNDIFAFTSKGYSICRKHGLAFATHTEWWEHIVSYAHERD